MSAFQPHVPDETLLEPYNYIDSVKGKDIRGKLIDAFQVWINAPTEKVDRIKKIVAMLHNASLLVDDIEDGSVLRRGLPVAHSIFGTPLTLNTANYVYFMALEDVHLLENRAAMDVFVGELLKLHRGQGQEILWRDRAQCPTEEQYRSMVLDKTGGLFRLAVGLMESLVVNPDTTESNGGGEGGGKPAKDYTALLDKLALYFQIRDDYINLLSDAYMKSKSFCEDLTEGKFSFPIIHAVRTVPQDTRLLNILKQRTEDVRIKLHAVEFMRSVGSFDYTRATLRKLGEEVQEEITALGGHPQLMALFNELDSQITEPDDVRGSGEKESSSISSSILTQVTAVPDMPVPLTENADRADSL